MFRESDIRALFHAFTKLRILVIGDVMADTYVYGQVERISPEAPVPVVLAEGRETRPGGAANVAMNIRSLGATPILISVCGEDEAGSHLAEILRAAGVDPTHIMQVTGRKTTVKTRIMAKGHQLLRIDDETHSEIDEPVQEMLLQACLDIVTHTPPDAIILEDYNKGMLTDALIRRILDAGRTHNIPVLVDPKKNNFFSYTGCTLFKPNLREVQESTGLRCSADPKSLKQVTELLREKLHPEMTLITLGDAGMYFECGDVCMRVPAHIRNVSDVSGAGDTVIGMAALCLAAHASPEYLVQLCNIAGGLACESAGVRPVGMEHLLSEALRLLT